MNFMICNFTKLQIEQNLRITCKSVNVEKETSNDSNSFNPRIQLVGSNFRFPLYLIVTLLSSALLQMLIGNSIISVFCINNDSTGPISDSSRLISSTTDSLYFIQAEVSFLSAQSTVQLNSVIMHLQSCGQQSELEQLVTVAASDDDQVEIATNANRRNAIDWSLVNYLQINVKKNV